MNSFLFCLFWVIAFILYFHYSSYALPIIDLRTQQASCACCRFRFKHLASVICYLVNFSSWGAFLDGIWSRSQENTKSVLINKVFGFWVAGICAVFEVVECYHDVVGTDRAGCGPISIRLVAWKHFYECLSHFQDYCYLVSLLGLLCLLIEPAEGTITLPHFHNQQRSQHNKKLEPLDGRSEVGEGDGFCIQLGNVRWGFALPLMICLQAVNEHAL